MRITSKFSTRSIRYEPGMGMVLAATTRINKVSVWRVDSERHKGRFYNVVGTEGPTCDFPDSQNRGEVCKHEYAIMIRETT
jgi:hypothetical protein